MSTNILNKQASKGYGFIAVQADTSGSRVCNLAASYPVKLIAPDIAHDRRAVLAFIISHGGGLVPKDHIELSAHVHSNARLGLLTQGSTKIYKSVTHDTTARQNLTVTIESGASLVVLQDPIQPFRNSRYEQRQVFHMCSRSNLCFLDWISEGRSAMGESWSLTLFRSSNEIWKMPNSSLESHKNTKPQGSRLILRDNMILSDSDDSKSSLSIRDSMDGKGAFGTLIIGGEQFMQLGGFFLREFSQQPRIGAKCWAGNKKEVENSYEGLIWTAASVRGFVIVKFGANEVGTARRWLREMMIKEGTILKDFGRQFLICLEDR
jgi:urease accessory protein